MSTDDKFPRVPAEWVAEAIKIKTVVEVGTHTPLFVDGLLDCLHEHGYRPDRRMAVALLLAGALVASKVKDYDYAERTCDDPECETCRERNARPMPPLTKH